MTNECLLAENLERLGMFVLSREAEPSIGNLFYHTVVFHATHFTCQMCILLPFTCQYLMILLHRVQCCQTMHEM